MWLVQLREHDAKVECDTVLQRIEWQQLSLKMNRKRKIASEALSIEKAFLWIIKLGGYIVRPLDSDARVISLWRGWEQL